MLSISQLRLSLDHSSEDLVSAIHKVLRISPERLISYKVLRRSIDARSKNRIKFVYSVDVSVTGEKSLLKRFARNKNIRKSSSAEYRNLLKAQTDFPLVDEHRPVVVGAGPCGYFAALLLAQMGFKPLLIERGHSVKRRTLQTFGFWRGRHRFDPNSNVQFGEGGAGTFSDGKLYSQVSDPDNYGRKVLEELVASGANSEILTHHHPHIGTFKLATVVRGLRKRIEDLGGEIRFEALMDEVVLESSCEESETSKPFQLVGIKLADGSFIRTSHLIVALGHSARDSFVMLEKVGVQLEQKLFSIGFRIEHPQLGIDQDRWGPMVGHPALGHAEYKLVHHASNGRCVYSFCMCPGGLVVASTSENNCVVTNGMSQHSRNERNANSALVVNLIKNDLTQYERFESDPLAGIAFQRSLEEKAFRLGGGDYFAPAQRLEDFVARKASISLGAVKPSYLPGIRLCDLNDSLPYPFIEAIRESLPCFAKQLPSFYNPDAVLTAVETRTSSPLRIARDYLFESVNTRGLFPAGEGAGYAGGILSAGIDGIRVAESVARMLRR